MAVRFALPDLGEGVVEAEIERWLVSAGDTIVEDQPMVEVMTDKATVEIPSPASGIVLGVHAQAGQVVPVGTVIVEIGALGESLGAVSATPMDVRHATRDAALTTSAVNQIGESGPSTVSVPGGSLSRIQATPLVRKLAGNLNVDLDTIFGTGPNGRITEEDVKAAAGAEAVAAAAAMPTLSSPVATSAELTGVRERRPLRSMRRMIAEHMIAAQKVPTVTVVEEVDLTALDTARTALGMSFLPFLVQAAAAGFRDVPEMNAHLDSGGDELIIFDKVDMGIAVQTGAGLMVPVLRDCRDLPLQQLDENIAFIANQARDGSLAPEQLRGGTFTITSAGKFGGLFTTPLLNVPQVGILGLHRADYRPVVVDGAIVIRRMANLSVSFDHRAVDGIDASRYLLAVIAHLIAL